MTYLTKKEELLDILKLEDNNRCYPALVRKRDKLHKWINDETNHLNTTNLNERIYYIVNGNNVCPNNKKYKFLTFSRGYGYCGKADVCKCCNEASGHGKTFKNKTLEQRQQIIKKRKNTCLRNYGVDNPSKVDSIKDKKEETCLKNYGVVNPMQSAKIRGTLQKANIKKYGTPAPSTLEVTKQKTKATNIYRYGDQYAVVRRHLSSDQIVKLDDFDFLVEENKTKSLKMIAQEIGVSDSAIYKKFYKNAIEIKYHLFSSIFEQSVIEFLEDLNIVLVCRTKHIISPLELDIYLPEYNIAIECNGSYWHSEHQGKDKTYHINKTRLCKEKGIQLIHIWEHDWNSMRELIKSRLTSKLGVSKRIYARKTSINKVSNKCSVEFLNRNHIQGSCAASVKCGLYYDYELIALLTVGKSRFNKNIEWELIRYCSKQGVNVIGGASKLYKWFIRHYSPETVISYSDRMWNKGELYRQLGFEYTHSSESAYYYTKDYLLFENRVAYQKHKLKDKLEIFDPSLTEWQNMQNNGFDRIWDCGNDVWIWNK